MSRLPIPGQDTGTWGTILNEFLSQAHQADGALKDGSVAEAKLDTAARAKLNTLAGQQGATGPTGSTGPQGIAGAVGATGVAGAQGAQGTTGSQGPAGPAGPQGATGPAGSGATGATGPAGAQGVAGAQGATGPQGPQGDPGPASTQGATGATGPQGSGGSVGATGAQGATGPQGTAGVQGATGATGTAGSAGVAGATGPIGATGPQGATGPTGSGGVQGATGATGPAGSGVPTGGSTGQVLSKSSNTDYDTQWVAQTGGVSPIDGGGETYYNAGDGGAAITLNLVNGNVQRVRLTANCTITLTAPAAGAYRSLMIYVVQDGTGGWTITWPAAVKWGDAGVPVLSTSPLKMDKILLDTVDGGTTWYGLAGPGGY